MRTRSDLHIMRRIQHAQLFICAQDKSHDFVQAYARICACPLAYSRHVYVCIITAYARVCIMFVQTCIHGNKLAVLIRISQSFYPR